MDARWGFEMRRGAEVDFGGSKVASMERVRLPMGKSKDVDDGQEHEERAPWHGR